jgi:hypothetical protein
MSYIQALIAWFMMRNSTLQDEAWTNEYLNKLVSVNEWAYNFSWWIATIVLVIVIIGIIASFIRGSEGGLTVSIGCSCFAIFLLAWPFLSWITLLLAKAMAESYGPEGMVNSGKFLISLVLYLALGVG